MSDAAALERLSFGALHAAEIAAIAAAKLIGCGDKIAADQAAVDALLRNADAEAQASKSVSGWSIRRRKVLPKAGAGVGAQVGFIHGEITGSALHFDRGAIRLILCAGIVVIGGVMTSTCR